MNFNACKKVEVYRLRHWPFLFLLGRNRTQAMPVQSPRDVKKGGEAYKCFGAVRIIKVILAILWEEKRSCVELWWNHPGNFLKDPELLFLTKQLKYKKAEEVTQYIRKSIENGRHFYPVSMIENWARSSQKDLQQKGWQSSDQHLMRRFQHRVLHKSSVWTSSCDCSAGSMSTTRGRPSKSAALPMIPVLPFPVSLNLAPKVQGRSLDCWLHIEVTTLHLISLEVCLLSSV